MAGAVIMVVVLLSFPVLVAIGGLVAAALLGGMLNHDSAARHKGSELLDLNV